MTSEPDQVERLERLCLQLNQKVEKLSKQVRRIERVLDEERIG